MYSQTRGTQSFTDSLYLVCVSPMSSQTRVALVSSAEDIGCVSATIFVLTRLPVATKELGLKLSGSFAGSLMEMWYSQVSYHEDNHEVLTVWVADSVCFQQLVMRRGAGRQWSCWRRRRYIPNFYNWTSPAMIALRWQGEQFWQIMVISMCSLTMLELV